MDFKLEFNLNRDIKVLQITDMQPVDTSQQRYDGRLNDAPFGTSFTKEEKYRKEFYYIDKAIKDNVPDLILVTGDIVYGEFDDNGSNLIEFIEVMDSYKIPWAPIFGNHDNESKLGVAWQCKQFENSQYCLFKRNNITGNGNYSIGIYNNGELIRVIFMMDSNGVWHGKTYGYLKDYPIYNEKERIEKISGLYPDQICFLKNECEEIDSLYSTNVRKTICLHIPPNFINRFAKEKGYQTTAYENNMDLFNLGGISLHDNKDFGEKCEQLGGFGNGSEELYLIMKKHYFDTAFVAHEHINTLSIDCDGIRVSFGIKTSTFDYYNKIGSLLFRFNNHKYSIEHKFIEELK